MTAVTTASTTDFLLARLSEDETAAREATSGGWTAYANGEAHGTSSNRLVADGVRSWNLAHIARHDPTRVLADCAARRAIVGLHEVVTEANACTICGIDAGLGDWEYDRNSFPCPTLRHLASVYADHDEYREEWRA